jgi:hypothetical protein
MKTKNINIELQKYTNRILSILPKVFKVGVHISIWSEKMKINIKLPNNSPNRGGGGYIWK